MQCDVCANKKATVHLTEIVDEQMTELHLCEDCAREKSVQMEQQFGLADLLAGLSDFGKQATTPKEVEKASKAKCASCGLTYDEFRKLGRFGCSECYSSFRDYLVTLLKKIHGSNQHLGKAPPGSVIKQIDMKTDTLEELKERLQKAIKAENFEEAARIRDKIHHLDREKKDKGKL